LKYLLDLCKKLDLQVAPFTGAWIEIRICPVVNTSVAVAPFTGAWIEIRPISVISSITNRRTLHGCVD